MFYHNIHLKAKWNFVKYLIIFLSLLIQMQMNPLKFNRLKLLRTFSENNWT